MLGGGDEYTYKRDPPFITHQQHKDSCIDILDNAPSLSREANEHPKIGDGIRFTLDQLVK
jgi:hypothetical protein